MSAVPPGPEAFRRLLAREPLLLVPGVFNALFARVMEDAGFECVYMSGFSVATTMLGRPDLGMLGLSEMAEQAARIVSAVEVPVLADADTGYGGVFSIRRTVEEYERAGLAGMHIEDQDLAVKRCGHLADIEVVESGAMLERLGAALRARRNDEFFIIARTDARRKLGFAEALRRARLYAEAGADAVMVEYLSGLDEMRRVVDAVKAPVVCVVIDSEHMPGPRQLTEAGVRIALVPISTLLATTAAAAAVAQALRTAGTTSGMLERMLTPAGLMTYIRYGDMSAWESAVRESAGVLPQTDRFKE